MTAATPQPDSTSEAIAELLHAHGDSIHRLGLRLCDEPDFAADLVQETFLRAYRGWGQFNGESQPLTWLYTIASRACHRMQRRRAGQPRRVEPLSDLIDPRGMSRPEDSGANESPLDYTIRQDEVGRLHHAIATLPAAFRLPLVLKELQGLTIREVAQVLGLQEATVKTRLHRARLTLRRELDSEGRPPPSDDAVTHRRRQCIDLLSAKLESLARGVPFPIENEQICSTCRSTLDALDRTQRVCENIETQPLPAELRSSVLDVLRELDGTT